MASSATAPAADHKSDDDKPTVVTRTVGECPVSTVTVFRDRAEVTRRITLETEAPGLYDVVMEGVTNHINEDSIRVKGTGHVTILEVSFAKNVKPLEPEGAAAAAEGGPESATERAAKLHARNQELMDRRHELEQAQAQVNKTIKLMDDYAARVMSNGIGSAAPAPAGAGAGGAAPAAEVLDLEFVDKLLDAHATRMEAADKRRNEIQRETRELDKEVSAIQGQLAAIGRSGRARTKTTNDVTVSVNATAPGEVVLLVTYQVSNASWSPSYDVRINSKDSTLELSYFGLVNQTTNEDWESTHIVLSTAEPAVGGVAPVLSTKVVRFKRPEIITHMRPSSAAAAPSRMRHARRGGDRTFQMNMQAAMFTEAMSLEDDEGDEGEAAPSAPTAATATAKVERSGASATFAIERPSRATTSRTRSPWPS